MKKIAVLLCAFLAVAVSANAVEESLSRRNVDWSTMKSSVKSTVARYIYEQTKRNPMILPIIEEI